MGTGSRNGEWEQGVGTGNVNNTEQVDEPELACSQV